VVRADFVDPSAVAENGLVPASVPGRPDRYPKRRTKRPILVIAVAVIAAVGLVWLGWTAWVHSRPPVSGAVQTWEITTDTEVIFTLTIDRPDPTVPATCRVIAQAANFETVGEKNITVGPGDTRLLDVREEMRTLRRATSVSLAECWQT
jgi:hypothetical protein